MKEITIKADGIFSSHEYKARVKPKTLGEHHGWDVWFQQDGRWVKKTRGNCFIRADTFDDILSQLLACGDWTYSKEVISIIDI